MKNIFKSFLALSVFVSVIAISSCTKTCDAGFEGSDCKTEIREKFTGLFQGPETCTVGTDNYTITITKASSDVLKVTMSNVYNQTYVATASIDGATLTVAQQTVATGVTVSGTGTLSGTTLTFTYSIVTAGTPDVTNACTFVGVKL